MSKFQHINNIPNEITQLQQKFYLIRDEYDLYKVFYQNFDILSQEIKIKSYLFLLKLLENLTVDL